MYISIILFSCFTNVAKETSWVSVTPSFGAPSSFELIVSTVDKQNLTFQYVNLK